ncbi:MAG: hypothetical protein HOE90_15770 [Bacteriovoracaceae bacterium]|jgi:hypothetical protein|nr:hypothetical protein [Bacteriovoracaceae bacterium]
MYFKLTVLFSLIFCSLCFGHTKSDSYSTWKIKESSLLGTISFRKTEIERISKLYFHKNYSSINFSEFLRKIFIVTSSNQECLATSRFQKIRSSIDYIAFVGSFKCQDSKNIQLQIESIFSLIPRHLHFAKVGGEDYFFSEDNNSHKIFGAKSDSATVKPARALEMLVKGIKHVSFGIDHILFLIVLIISFSSLKEITLLVSGFTIGHFISLVLSTQVIFPVSGASIESLIGFSISIVCIEYLLTRHQLRSFEKIWAFLVPAGIVMILLFGSKTFSSFEILALAGFVCFHLAYVKKGVKNLFYSGVITTLVGVVHGFGFQGYFQNVGGASALTNVFLFNIGVELGQLMIVAATILAMKLFKDRMQPAYRESFLKLSMSTAYFVGFFWFSSRALLLVP